MYFSLIFRQVFWTMFFDRFLDHFGSILGPFWHHFSLLFRCFLYVFVDIVLSSICWTLWAPKRRASASASSGSKAHSHVWNGHAALAAQGARPDLKAYASAADPSSKVRRRGWKRERGRRPGIFWKSQQVKNPLFWLVDFSKRPLDVWYPMGG